MLVLTINQGDVVRFFGPDGRQLGTVRIDLRRGTKVRIQCDFLPEVRILRSALAFHGSPAGSGPGVDPAPDQPSVPVPGGSSLEPTIFPLTRPESIDPGQKGS